MRPLPLRERWLPVLLGCAGIVWSVLSARYLLAVLFAAYVVFVLSPPGDRVMAAFREATRRPK